MGCPARQEQGFLNERTGINMDSGALETRGQLLERLATQARRRRRSAKEQAPIMTTNKRDHNYYQHSALRENDQEEQ